jgi:hypothetical protein
MPEEPFRFLAVYPTEADARRAAARVEALGVDPGEVRIDAPLDHVASVEGEMHQEMDRTIAGPGAVGPFTPETRRGMLPGIAIGAVIGLVIALPFAAIGFGGWAAGLRVLVVAIVGIAVGATVGWLIGGDFGAERPEDPLAAERGVTMSVPARRDLQRLLISTDPLRLDVVDSVGNTVRPVESRPDESIARRIGRNVADEKRAD